MITHSKAPMALSLVRPLNATRQQIDEDLKTLRALAHRDPEFCEVLRAAAQAAIEDMMEARG